MKSVSIIILLLFLLLACSQTNEPLENSNLDLGPVVTNLVSSSLGANWEQLSEFPGFEGKLHTNIVYDMIVYNSEVICATNYEGIYQYDFVYPSWKQINSGLIKIINEQPYDVFRNSAITSVNDKLFCASTNMNSDIGIFEYDFSKEKWNRKKEWNTKGEVYSLVTSKNGYLFAGLSEENSYSVWMSKDEGNNWLDISNNLKNSPTGHIYCFAFNKSEIFIGTATGIYSTKNLGETWSRIYFPYSEVNTIAINSQGIFYASSRNKAFRKNTSDSEWSEIFSVPSGRNVNKLFIGADSMLFLACCDGVWSSSDKGNTLKKIGLDNKLPVRLSFNKNGDLFAATKRSGVFVSY